MTSDANTAERRARSNLPRGMILVLIAAVGVPVVAAAATGSLSIPHNDAWALLLGAGWFLLAGGRRYLT